MSHIKNIRANVDVTREAAREYLEEGVRNMTPGFGRVLVGLAPCWRVEFEVFTDGVVAMLYDPHGCFVALGEVVL